MLLSDLKSKCTNIKSDTEKLKSELPAQEANNMHLFVVGKRTMKELAGLQTAMEDVDRKRKVPRCKFHRDPATEQLLAFKNATKRLEEGKSTSALWQQQRQQEMKQQQHKHRLVTSQKGQNNRSIYQHLSSQNNALTEQGTINGLGQISFILTNQNQTLTSPLSFKIDKNNVVLEGGGQFEEGQAYMIRDRQGNARKMIWTKGDFMPLQEPDKSNISALNQSRADLSQSQFSKLPDVPVHTSSDISGCWLTSMALIPGDRLLLTDCDNYSLKLVDTENKKLVSQVILPGKPCDLCLLPGDRAAVTLPDLNKIQFVSTQGNVTLQDVVEVDGECRGIDFCDDNLIVSYDDPCKVVLMDMKGNVKKSVDKDSSGNPLFIYPEHLTGTRGSQTPPAIYVSDWDTNTITKLSISLEVLQTYHDPILKSPHGLTAVGDNQLLVCGKGNNNILLLDTLTGKITQLLGKEAGIECPFSVAYCPLRKMLFVTCSRHGRPELENFVKVFNLV